MKWFNKEKGFGFVELGDGSGDAFLHIRAVEAAGDDPEARSAALADALRDGAASVAEVARRAGVSVAAPYRHFADKADLLATVAAAAAGAYPQQGQAPSNPTARVATPPPGAGWKCLTGWRRRRQSSQP